MAHGMPEMALVPILEITMPSMMKTSVGTMNQNPVDVSVATTMERTQPIEISPVFPIMTRRMPQSTQSHTIESFATFRGQDKESNYDLMNNLTHQMAKVLNPLTESNNQRFDAKNKQVHRMVETLHPNKDVEDPIIR